MTNTNLARGVVRLHSAGLHVTIPSSYYLASNSTPQIVRQKPRAGATVRAGTAVELTLDATADGGAVRDDEADSRPRCERPASLERRGPARACGSALLEGRYVPPLEDANVRTLYGATASPASGAAGTVMRQRRQMNGEERIVPVALSVRTATG